MKDYLKTDLPTRKRGRRILALLLVCALVFGLLPAWTLPVSATEQEVEQDEKPLTEESAAQAPDAEEGDAEEPAAEKQAEETPAEEKTEESDPQQEPPVAEPEAPQTEASPEAEPEEPDTEQDDSEPAAEIPAPIPEAEPPQVPEEEAEEAVTEEAMLAGEISAIGSVSDWNQFVSAVNNGNTFAGKTVTLSADVGVVTSMIRTDKTFNGVFDGGGHTLTVNFQYGDVRGAALFPYVASGSITVKNLKLAGTINGGIHAAGVIGEVAENAGSTMSIDNVAVYASIQGGSYLGGFLGHAGGGGSFTVTNSQFLGSIRSNTGTANFIGGFAGWGGRTKWTFRNCQFGGQYGSTTYFNAVGFYYGPQGNNGVTVEGFASNSANVGSGDSNGRPLYTSTYDQWGEAVAQVGVIQYDNLSAALSAWADGTTLTLLDDVTTASTITISGTKTLDLNGHTIRMTGSGSVFSCTDAGANLTLLNGTITGGNAGSGGGLYVSKGAVTLKGCTVTGNVASNQGSAVSVVGGTLTAEHTSFTANPLKNSAGCLASVDVGGGTLVLIGGEIVGGGGDGTSTYKERTNGLEVRSGSVVISGGLKVKSPDYLWIKNSSQLRLGEALTEGAEVNIFFNWGNTAGPFTKNWKSVMGSADPAQFFTSAVDKFSIGMNSTGEAQLGIKRTLTFHANGHGTAPKAQTVADGCKATEPDALTETGWTFGGWYRDAACTTAWSFDSDTVSGDTTLYAKWTINQYTIHFDSAGGTAVESITQDYDTAVTAPAKPTRTGYTFDGWDREIPETMPAENVTIRAQWKINRYTITFDTQGGTAVEPITQDYDTAVTAPAKPTRTGYTFDGWDREIPETMPAENVTITAQWKINRYTITFDTQGGTAVEPITQDYDTAVTAPAKPTRTGYTFDGWDREIPETMPAENVTITAAWTLNTYQITFDANGGSGAMAGQTGSHGIPCQLQKNLFARGRYVFAGWNTEAGGGGTAYADETSITLTGPVTLYAQWQVDTSNSIVGTVVQNGQVLGGATVTLMQGDETVAVSTTNAGGVYSFAVEDGLYNIVVEKDGVTRTQLVDLSGTEDLDITLPAESITSRVAVEGTSTPDIMVGGLDVLAEQLSAEHPGSAVAVTMSVKQTESVDTDVASAIGALAPYQTLAFFDITVAQQIGDAAAVELSDTSEILEIIVPFTFSNGKQDVAVYRYHNGQPERLTESGSKLDGTCRLDRTNGRIYIYTNRFSIYSVGFTQCYNISGHVRYGNHTGSVTLSLLDSAQENVVRMDEVLLNDGSGEYSFSHIPRGDYYLRTVWTENGEQVTLTKALTVE